MGSLWNRSGTIERYADDLRAAGALAYFFAGGTTTPLTVYRDAGEASAHPNPVVADAHGRWPDVFVPYTLGYDVQTKTAEGTQLTYSQNIPNPDPVELTVTPDPATSLTTGMIHGELINGTKTGYVRLNGRTIGNASSGGTERQNADTSALFTYLWNNLGNSIAPVSGGRGGSAASDFAANKTITLPNWQGAMPVGLDDMGEVAGGFFSGLSFTTGGPTTAGSSLGVNSLTLDITQIPAHTHSGTTNVESPTHTHTATTGAQSADHTHSGTTSTQGAHQHDALIDDAGHRHFLFNQNATNVALSATNKPSIGAIYPTSQDYLIGGRTEEPDRGLSELKTTGVRVKSSGGAADDKVASAGDHTHTITTGIQSASHTHTVTTTDGSHSHTFSTSTAGGGLPMNNLPRSCLVTWFIKL